LVAAGDRDVGAEPGQPLRQGPAQAVGCSGHEDGLLIDRAHRVRPRRPRAVEPRRGGPPPCMTPLTGGVLAIHVGDEDMTLKISTVMLGVDDLDRSKAFYAGGLGGPC